MANAHFGNLADVFKHLALGELFGAMRPAEYWESHCGSAVYTEAAEIPPERHHGVHTFLKVAGNFEALRCSFYYRVLGQMMAAGVEGEPPAGPARFPGSPMLARLLLGENPRRLLFCDTDAESLQTLQTSSCLPTSAKRAGGPKEVSIDKLECVQDDGVSVLRGAGMILPEPWTGSTLAFIDPYDVEEVTAAGISPLELVCELGNRGIAVVLWYGFQDDGQRVRRHEKLVGALEKARLLKRGAQRFEGSLRKVPGKDGGVKCPTQWGWGLMTLNVPAEALQVVMNKMRALETAYEKAELSGWGDGVEGGGAGVVGGVGIGGGSGAWRLVQASM